MSRNVFAFLLFALSLSCLPPLRRADPGGVAVRYVNRPHVVLIAGRDCVSYDWSSTVGVALFTVTKLTGRGGLRCVQRRGAAPCSDRTRIVGELCVGHDCCRARRRLSVARVVGVRHDCCRARRRLSVAPGACAAVAGLALFPLTSEPILSGTGSVVVSKVRDGGRGTQPLRATQSPHALRRQRGPHSYTESGPPSLPCTTFPRATMSRTRS